MISKLMRACLAAAASIVWLMPAHASDPSIEGAKAADLLKELIRIDTSNPPGDTQLIANHLKGLFDRAEIPSEIIVAPNGKAAHFIARLKGDGSKRPVLIASHVDVVPWQKERWTVDPLSGGEKDGFIYGRGAIDNKGAVAAFARAVLRLKEEKAKLKRDIIFLAEADEEQGTYSTTWLAQEHWDKIDAEFTLNEGGRAPWGEDRKVRMITVTTNDKISINIKLKTEGPSGHSSKPLPVTETANGQLIAALEKLSVYETPIQLTEDTRKYLQTLASVNRGRPLAEAISKLLAAQTPDEANALAREVIALDDTGGWGVEGLMRNTLVVTMINAGVKPNVIPGSAEALVNARLLPGHSVEALLAEVAAAIGNPRVKLEVAGIPALQARTQIKSSRLDTDLYKAIQRAAIATWPGATVVPALFSAGTDATPWRLRNVPTYGIGPFPVDRDSGSRVHGDDERVAVEAVHQGTEFVYRILRDVTTKR